MSRRQQTKYTKGEKVGAFTFLEELAPVIRKDGSKYRMAKFTCVCGRETTAGIAAVKAGNIKGCNVCKGMNKRLSKGESGFNHLLRDYKTKASKAGREFYLTTEQFRSLTQKDCFYCGRPPITLYNVPYADGWGSYYYNGIDRVDSSKGYTIDNCVPCCPTCNYAKLDRQQDDFLAWAVRVADNHSHFKRPWWEDFIDPDTGDWVAGFRF